MKIRFFCVLFAIIFLFLAACGEMGRKFKDFQALKAEQENKGFVFLGRFDDEWPAEIAEIRSAMDTIQFKGDDGTPHDYAGFTGYELKLIRLKSGKGAHGLVLFRSKEKKAK